MRALENKKRKTNMSGRYNKEINNFHKGRNNLDRLNRQNQAFQQRNEQRKAKIDARAEVIASSQIENGVSVFGAKAFNPEMQAYVKDLEQKYGLQSADSFPQLTEELIPANLFEKIPANVNSFIKKAEFSPALVKKVQTVVEKAAPQGEKSTSSWASNLVKELKAVNITVTETFMDRLMDFLGNTRVLRPLTAAMVMMTLVLTSCSPTEAGNTNEATAAETAQIPAEENETAVSTDVVIIEGETQVADPGDTDVEATKDALLSQLEIEEMVTESYADQNISATEQEVSDLAELLFEVGDISRNTNWDPVRNENTGRDFVRLNDPSVYGEHGVYITRGKNGERVYINGETIGITDLDQIDVTGTDYVAVAKNTEGQTVVVDGETFQWVSIFEGAKDQYQASEETETGSETEVNLENRDAYVATIEKYIPRANVDQIINMIPEAQAILAGGEYDENLSNQERQTLAFAIVAELETQRGVQPLSFESDGKTYFYDSSVESVTQRWIEYPNTDESKELATIKLYVPIYRNKETGNVMYYWNEQWNEAENSSNIDYSMLIDSTNMTNGVIDFSARDFEPFTNSGEIINIPMICLDDKSNENEVFPFKRSAGGGESIVFFSQIDFMLINPDILYGINTKLVTNGQTPVAYPHKVDAKWFSTIGDYLQFFDGLFKEGSTYYVGAAPNTDEAIKEWDYSSPSTTSNSNIDDFLNNQSSFWSNVQKEAYIQIKPIFFYDNN